MSGLVTVAVVVAAVLFAVLVLFQAALAAGAPWGRAAYGGADARLPTRLRVASAVAVLVWTGVALVILRRAGVPVWAPLPEPALPFAAWVVVALLGVGVVLNTITRSRIERAVWLPVTLLLFASCLVIALAA